MTEKQKLGIAIGLGVLLLAGLGIGGYAILKGSSGDSDADLRQNTLILANDYIERGELDRALGLLEQLLLKDPRDQEAIALRDRAIDSKQEQEASRRELERLALEARTPQTTVLGPAPVDPALAALELQKAEAEARAAEAAARERTAQAAQREAELELARAQTEAQRVEAERRAREEAEARAAEEARLASLSAAEAEKERRIKELLEQARREQEAQQFESSRQKIQEALELDRNRALTYARLAENFLEEDSDNQVNLDTAIQNAQRAQQLDSSLWEPYFTLGRVYAETRQFDNAINQFKEATDRAPTNARAWFELGNAQFQARRFQDARQSYLASIELDSRNERAYHNLGATYESLGDTNRALDAYLRAVGELNTYANAYYRMGEIYRNRGELDRAVTNLRQAYNQAPENASYVRSLATVLHAQQRYSEALPLFQRAVELQPADAANVDKAVRAVNNYNLATVLLDLNRPEEALPYAAKAVELDGSHYLYTYALGLAAKMLGGEEQAEIYLRASIRSNANYAKAKIELAALYISQERLDAALTELLAAQRLDPASVEVNSNLATVYRMKGLNQDSLRHAELAVQARSNSPGLRLGLALTQSALGNYQAAKTSLEAAINLDSQFWEAHHRLGEVLIALDQKAQARTVLEGLLGKNPNYVDAQAVRSLLSGI